MRWRANPKCICSPTASSIYLEEAPDRIIDLLKNARQPMFLVCVTDQVRRLTASGQKKPAKSETGAVAGKKSRLG